MLHAPNKFVPSLDYSKLYTAFFIVVSTLFFNCCAFAQVGVNEKWPSHPIRMVVPFSAGGTIDVMARKVAKQLGDSLGMSVVVDNRAGANGIIGADLVAKSPADGYTLLLMTGSFTANSVMYKKLPFDIVKDFAPITQIARSNGLVLVVNNDVPVNSLKELISLAQLKPGQLTYGSAGQGNLTNLAAELFNNLVNIQIVHIPYKGSGQAITDLLAKQIDMSFVSIVGSTNLIKEKRVKALAIASSQRAPTLPDVPTFLEFGIKGMEQIIGWYGLWFPAGTPQDRIEKLQMATAKFTQQPDIKAEFEELGLISIASSPKDFTKFIHDDIAYQNKLFKIAKLTPQ